MRIGVAGVGRIGAFHAETLHDLDEVDSIVVADANAERAASVAAELGVEHVAEPGELFAQGLDGLVIAAATDAHAALILAGVEAGVPVFCEKPVAPDVATTRAVFEKVRSSSVAVQIGFQRRFDAGFTAAREAVRSGRLGWVHTMRAGTLDPAPPPPEYVATSGGLFRDCSVHDFDAIRWVSAQEVEEAYAVGANRGADYFRTAGDVDTAAAILTLTDGTFVHVAATRYNAAGYDVRLDVLGSENGVVVGLDDRLPVTSAEPGVGFPAGRPYPAFFERFRPAYVAELAGFVGVVAGRADPACTVADALEAFLIAEACELSRAEHRPVAMAEVR